MCAPVMCSGNNTAYCPVTRSCVVAGGCAGASGQCHASRPVVCPSGLCVRSASECAGFVKTHGCPLDKTHITCADGACAPNLLTCAIRAFRSLQGTKYTSLNHSNTRQAISILPLAKPFHSPKKTTHAHLHSTRIHLTTLITPSPRAPRCDGAGANCPASPFDTGCTIGESTGHLCPDGSCRKSLRSCPLIPR